MCAPCACATNGLLLCLPYICALRPCSDVVSEGVMMERRGGREEEEALFGSDDDSNSTNEVLHCVCTNYM